MRIVVWNCAMALHKKWDRLKSLKPDLAIVPECAEPSRNRSRLKSQPDCSTQWIGDNQNKGLGVFAFSGLSLRRDESFNPIHKYFLPIRVSGGSDFRLLGLWAFGHRAPGGTAIPGLPTTTVLDQYREFLLQGPLVVAGDFNNSVYWDRPGKIGNFAGIAERLASAGLRSAYHASTGAGYGAEFDPTHFWLKGKGDYHIDYCFLPESWKLTAVEVGKREDWMPISDHAPLVVDCELPH